MTILVDECVNKDLIEILRHKGIKLITISESKLQSGVSDSNIFYHALDK